MLIPGSLCAQNPAIGFTKNRDTAFESSHILLLGAMDSSCVDALVNLIRKVRFSSILKFSAFPVAVEHMKSVAPIDFSSNRNARWYRTLLSKTYKDSSVNFAGHFCFFYVCGGTIGCHSLVVDAKTGKVYDGPDAGWEYQFKVDSRMLIINPPDDNGWYEDVPDLTPEIYLWNPKTFKFEPR